MVGLAGDFVEETAGDRGSGLAPFVPAQRDGQREPALGPGDAHVAETPLFVDGRVVGLDRSPVRQHPLFHAHHVDLGELQPLGGVEGQKRHRVAL